MQLTTAQSAALKAAILAETDPTLVAALAVRNDTGIAEWYNAATSFVVWRSAVPVAEYRAAVVWTEVDALTVGRARIWDWLTGSFTLPINAADLNVRQGIADAFGPSTTTRSNLLAVAKRVATRAEQLLATGTGSTNSPGTMGAEGLLSAGDVSAVLN